MCFRGGIRDGDILVKLNGEPLMSTSDLKEALNQDTTLLLEVRRGNDDLLFNIEPDIIMQWCHHLFQMWTIELYLKALVLSYQSCTAMAKGMSNSASFHRTRTSFTSWEDSNLELLQSWSSLPKEILYERHLITAHSLWSRFEAENDFIHCKYELAILYFIEEDKTGDIL